MSKQITTIDKTSTEIAVLLNPDAQVNYILPALKGQMINVTSERDLYNIIADNLDLILLDLKQTLSEPDKRHICTSMVNTLKKRKVNLRNNEIQIAFNNGIHSKYGPYYGINVVSLTMFITEYLKDVDREEALRVHNLPPATNKIPNQAEIFEMSKENALSAYKLFLKNKTADRYGSPAYDFLFKIKLLMITQPEIDLYQTQAKEIVFLLLQDKAKKSPDYIKRQSLKNELKDFTTKALANDVLSLAHAGLVLSNAKRLAVEKYFADLSEMEIDLNTFSEMIEEQKTLSI